MGLADPGLAGDLAEARRIVFAGLRGHRARVFLFGSRARGDGGAASDIDIGILPEVPLPAGALAEIREELEESGIPYQVDVVDLSQADAHLRERVLREGVLWTA